MNSKIGFLEKDISYTNLLFLKSLFLEQRKYYP